ncbi:AraC family transcriptional regulator [Caballeronia sp. dw_19]|uniref:AraC family transcriptional regulator n=1 Tax=Caballeronia sp. dw_19 TaxID=2719791 RepID=UPI0021038BA1|nr:AraC family transcriptional regulator [Caballeronia sp. dw_19]
MLEKPLYLRNSADMPNDLFSDVLTLVGAQTVLAGGFAAGGPWALRFPAPDKIKFAALIKGACWLRVEGDEAAIRVETGDVVLLSAKRAFVLASDLAVAPLDAKSLFFGQGKKFVTLGDGQDCVQLGGHIVLDSVNGNFLATAMPPLIHVQASSAHAADLKWLIERLVREQAEEKPGSGTASTQLAQLMFIELLRAHLAASGEFPAGWLRALGDSRLVPALRLMHGEPGREWQLNELAGECAMSRTTFVLHFKTSVGVTPFVYLTEWRMRLAERALREGDLPVAVVGRSLGYTSESAFSNAFKRVIGHAPRRYRSERVSSRDTQHSEVQ